MQQANDSSRLFPSVLIMAVLLLLCSAAAPRNAVAQTDGAALYHKHCAGCHHEGSTLKLADPLLHSVRVPPPGMPLFDEEKLSDRDVRTIGEYLRPGSQQPAAKKAEPERKASAKAGKPYQEKKSWMKGFGTSDL